MTVTPCRSHPRLYDIVLFDDVPDTTRAEARAEAAALCDSCPARQTCDQRVTADTTPMTVDELPPGWMPPLLEGVPEPEPPPQRRWSADRRAGAAMVTGRSYIPPCHRPAAFARMAGDLAREGRDLEQIAAALCLTPETVRDLLLGYVAVGAAA